MLEKIQNVRGQLLHERSARQALFSQSKISITAVGIIITTH